MWCVFFCNLPPSTTAVPSGSRLCLAEEGSRSGCRQETTGTAVSSESNDIMGFMDNHYTVGESNWVWPNHPLNRYSSIYGYSPHDRSIYFFLRNTDFVFCLWCTFTLKMYLISTYLVDNLISKADVLQKHKCI